jgi:hypothetical protein
VIGTAHLALRAIDTRFALVNCYPWLPYTLPFAVFALLTYG